MRAITGANLIWIRGLRGSATRLVTAHFVREIFSSAPDQVIIIRLTSDKPGGISFAASMTREQDVDDGFGQSQPRDDERRSDCAG